MNSTSWNSVKASNFWAIAISPPSRIIAPLAILIFVAGCGSVLKRDAPGKTIGAAPSVSGPSKRGGYYLDDGPGDDPPADLASIPDAVPRDEPLRRANMRPYVALGKSYTPMTILESYKERGIASWYGRRYHGQKTASGELYDMYAMTAAHATLPLPSYVRVTNLRNGKSVVVRVNDRGPFLSGRLIDLSYTAAYKLDVLDGGSAQVEVETILPDAEAKAQIAAAPAPDATPAPTSASDRDKESFPPSFAADEQNTETVPDLFEAAYLPVQPNPSGFVAPPITGSEANGGRIYLQLGAFSAYDSADNFLARMRSEFPSIDPLGIVAKDGLFKVHAGPYPDQAVARQAAAKIAQALSIRPILLVR